MNGFQPIASAPEGRTVLTRRGSRWFASDYAGEIAPPDEWLELRDDSMERFEAFKATLNPAKDSACAAPGGLPDTAL